MKLTGKTVICLGTLLVFLCVLAAPSFAETKGEKNVKKIPANKLKIIKNFKQARRFILCVDGYKFFQTVGPSWGNGSSPAVSTVQLFEEKKGKSVPAKCTKGKKIIVK